MEHYLYACDTQKRRRLLWHRYEFLIYRLLRNGLESGDIFCRDSVRFRSFEDDLLDDQRWQAKEELIAETGLMILNQPLSRITCHRSRRCLKIVLPRSMSASLLARTNTVRLHDVGRKLLKNETHLQNRSQIDQHRLFFEIYLFEALGKNPYVHCAPNVNSSMIVSSMTLKLKGFSKHLDTPRA